MKLFIILVVVTFISFGCVAPKENRNQPIAAGKNGRIAKIYRQMASNIIIHKDYKNIPKALEYLDKSDLLAPNSYKTAYLKGISYMLENKFSKAFKWLKKSISINSKYAQAHNALGIWYAKDNQFEKAVIQFGIAIGLSKYSYPVTSYYNRALAYENLGKYHKAIEDLNSAISLGKYNRNNLLHLAQDYFFLRKFKKSIETLNIISKKSELRDLEKLIYAKDLFYLKKYKKSEVYLRKLLESKDNSIKNQALIYIRLIKKSG